MILRALKIPKWAGTALAVAMFPIWGPVIGMLWVEENGRSLKRRMFGPRVGEWQQWFAWHPVTLDLGWGDTVWFETVERCALGSSYGYGITYRRPSTPTVGEKTP